MAKLGGIVDPASATRPSSTSRRAAPTFGLNDPIIERRPGGQQAGFGQNDPVITQEINPRADQDLLRQIEAIDFTSDAAGPTQDRRFEMKFGPGAPSLWDQTAKQWERSGRNIDLDFLWHRVAMGEIDESQAVEAERQFQDISQKNPIEGGNWVKNLWLQTVGVARPMTAGAVRGAAAGTAAAGVAAVAGQLGPQVAFPEEIVTVPGAFAAGSVAGSISYWAQQGSGSVYRQARQQGLPHDTAKYAAAAAGPLYAFIEYSQVDKIIPGLGKLKGKLLNKAIQVGLNTAKEIGEEGVQKLITDGAVNIGKLVEGQIQASDVPATVKEMAMNALVEMKEAAGPLAVLQIPGAAVGVAETARDADIIGKVNGILSSKGVGLFLGEKKPVNTEDDIAAEFLEAQPEIEEEAARNLARRHIEAQILHERELYDQLLEKHEAGDKKATADLNTLQQRFHLPTFEALLDKIGDGERRYAEYIQEGVVGKGPVRAEGSVPLVLPLEEKQIEATLAREAARQSKPVQRGIPSISELDLAQPDRTIAEAEKEQNIAEAQLDQQLEDLGDRLRDERTEERVKKQGFEGEKGAKVEATQAPAAEEGIKVFHGAHPEKAKSVREKGIQIGKQGFSVAKSREAATEFGDEIIEFTIKPGAKIATATNMPEGVPSGSFNTAAQERAVQLAKDKGFDVIDIESFVEVTGAKDVERELQILNPDIVSPAQPTPAAETGAGAANVAAAPLRVESVDRQGAPDPRVVSAAEKTANTTGKNIYILKGDRGWFSRTVPPKTGDYYTVTPAGRVIFGAAPEAPESPGRAPRIMSGFDPGLDRFIPEIAKPLVEQVKAGVKATVNLLKEIKKLSSQIIEPARVLEKKFGGTPFVSAIKAIHRPEAKALEFEEQRVEVMNTNIKGLRDFFAQFDAETQFNFMKAFAGKANSVEAEAIQREAREALPKELRDPRIEAAMREISEANWKRLGEVSEGKTPWIADYFYGIYKEQDGVDQVIADHFKTTERFLKKKSILSVADAINHGLTPRFTNYIDNLAAESIAIARLESMKWLREDLMKNGKGLFIDDFADVEPAAGWRSIKDPVFEGLLAAPELADVVNNLISTNKITRQPALNGIRKINNTIRIVKFIGGVFHARVIIKASMADSGYLGFLYKRTAFRWITPATKKGWDKIVKSQKYRRLLELGLGHKYSIEQDAQEQFSGFVDKMVGGNYPGATLKGVKSIIKLPVNFTGWMFNQWIPKIKYEKTLDAWRELEMREGRPATDWELINIIKEGQNFYGEMNERLFGRSGTATTATRFAFLAPGFAEGNYRTILKGGTQWGMGEGFSASRSRSNIFNSLLITGIAATIATRIMTGHWPEKPEKFEDIRDLFKADTGRVDKRGRKVMIDLLDYDKDYFNILYNVVAGRPDKAITESIRRVGGMKAPMLDISADLLQVALGRAIYDWKGDRIVEVTDTMGEKILKVASHEIRKLEPIPVSVARTSQARHADRLVAFLEGVSGYRPTLTEKDKREGQIMRLGWSLKGQQIEAYESFATISRPREAVEFYNNKVRDIMEGPLVPEETAQKWLDELIIDIDPYLQNKAHDASLEGISEDQKKKADKSIRILKNFGIDSDEAAALLKQWYARDRKRIPRSPIESHRILGRNRKRRRLEERMGKVEQ